jgi:hypothetical protein
VEGLLATVQVNSEIGTITWSNGADLDPDVLYAIVTQQPMPDYSALESNLPNLA